MKSTIEKDLAALRHMTPKQLRQRYAELYGEPSRSGNRQWLIRRCAWRIQALAEGGLAERSERSVRDHLAMNCGGVSDPEGEAVMRGLT